MSRVSDGLSATDAGLSGDGTDSPVKPAAGRLQPRAYVLLMLLIPALFVASAIPIARSDSFPVESGDPFILNADYAFSLKHVNCDVVIYGDSTALTGLDPTVVERSTGLKTCNIAQAQSILHILGMLALDTYLKNNTPPRYIVMQFAPETLSRGRSDFFWPEGLTLLLRKRSLLEALPTLLKHPVQAYYFSIWAIKAKVTSLTRLPIDFAATEAVFRAHRGLLTLPKPPQTGCLNNLAYARPTVEWVRGLKDKYGNQGTRVVVNVSPLPACSPIVPRVAAETRNVTDNTLSVFPIGLFCDLDRHLTLEGAERASLELAEQLVPGSGGSGRVN
jgi:hypothetical protein